MTIATYTIKEKREEKERRERRRREKREERRVSLRLVNPASSPGNVGSKINLVSS